MNKYLIAICFFLLLTLNSFGQEISIVVYEGHVSFDKKSNLLPKTRYEISPNTSVHYATNSKFVIFSKTKLYKKVSSDGATISYKEILDNLKANAPSTFLRLMWSYHEMAKTNTDAIGSGIGAAKGLNNIKDREMVDKGETIFPFDSAKTGSKSINLDWNLKNSIMNGRLYVIHQPTKDTLYNQPATNSGKVTVNLEKTGPYQWFIYSKSDKRKRINQTFIKQDELEHKKMKLDFVTFKEVIAILDEDLQTILIAEYKLKYGIID
jgi:hypothetical protein